MKPIGKADVSHAQEIFETERLWKDRPTFVRQAILVFLVIAQHDVLNATKASQKTRGGCEHKLRLLTANNR